MLEATNKGSGYFEVKTSLPLPFFSALRHGCKAEKTLSNFDNTERDQKDAKRAKRAKPLIFSEKKYLLPLSVAFTFWCLSPFGVFRSEGSLKNFFSTFRHFSHKKTLFFIITFRLRKIAFFKYCLIWRNSTQVN